MEETSVAPRMSFYYRVKQSYWSRGTIKWILLLWDVLGHICVMY